MNVPCRLIEDLLPLYHDEICSQESRELVEDHLQGCPACQKSLDRLRESLLHPEQDEEEAAALKTLQGSWKRAKRFAFGKGAALVVLAMLLVVGIPLLAAFLTTPKSPVSGEDIQVSQVCQLEDGTIVFHLYVDDGMVVDQLTFDVVNGDSLYFTPLQPILKTKRTEDKGFCNVYVSFCMMDPLETFDQKKGNLGIYDWIKSVYVGTPGDAVLVWQEGMDLPQATPAMEDMMNHYIGLFGDPDEMDWDAYYETYAAFLGDEMFRKEATP